MICQFLLLVPHFSVTHHSEIIKRSNFNHIEIKVTRRHTKEATPSCEYRSHLFVRLPCRLKKLITCSQKKS